MAPSTPGKRPELDGNSTEKNVAAKKDPIHIDRNGNLQLIVGPDAVRMQVDANALRRASKVFNRMLFGPFKESKQTAEWTVELPEDDPEALTVIFHAAHGNFGSIPQRLKLSELFDVTAMADKYAMMGSLRPWATAWTSGSEYSYLIRSENKNETTYQDLQKLFVLYCLGTSLKLVEVVARLVVKSRVNANGDLLFTAASPIDEQGLIQEGGEWKDIGLLPDFMIDAASTLRGDLISHLLGELRICFKAYASGESASRPGCICNPTALGLMIQCLVREDLWPLPSADDVQSSVTELSNVISQISVQIKRTLNNHSEPCNLHLPHGLGVPLRSQLEWDVHRQFSSYFAARFEAEASGN